MQKSSLPVFIILFVFCGFQALPVYSKDLSGPASAPPPTAPGQALAPVTISTVLPTVISLAPGGAAITVIFNGHGLNTITGVAIVRNSMPVSTVIAGLGQAMPERRLISLQAGPTAVGGTYQLRLLTGSSSVDIPATIARIEIAAPRQIGTPPPETGGTIRPAL